MEAAARQRGGVLLDLGVHHIDLIRFLTGREITGVRASVFAKSETRHPLCWACSLEGGSAPIHSFSLAAAGGDHVAVQATSAFCPWPAYVLDVQITDFPVGAWSVGRALRRAGAIRHLRRALKARRAHHSENRGYRSCWTASSEPDSRISPLDVPDIADGFAAPLLLWWRRNCPRDRQMETPTAFQRS